MDSFTLSLAYGIEKISNKRIIVTSILVGVFHFFMPLSGNLFGIVLFNYIIIKPKYVLFFVFLILSIDMIIHFFEEEHKLTKLNLFGILFFALSVSLDSFSVGIGLEYIYSNILASVITFSVVSMIFTLIGFKLGNKISEKLGKYSFFVGSAILLIYSVLVLTK